MVLQNIKMFHKRRKETTSAYHSLHAVDMCNAQVNQQIIGMNVMVNQNNCIIPLRSVLKMGSYPLVRMRKVVWLSIVLDYVQYEIRHTV